MAACGDDLAGIGKIGSAVATVAGGGVVDSFDAVVDKLPHQRPAEIDRQLAIFQRTDVAHPVGAVALQDFFGGLDVAAGA